MNPLKYYLKQVTFYTSDSCNMMKSSLAGLTIPELNHMLEIFFVLSIIFSLLYPLIENWGSELIRIITLESER